MSWQDTHYIKHYIKQSNTLDRSGVAEQDFGNRNIFYGFCDGVVYVEY